MLFVSRQYVWRHGRNFAGTIGPDDVPRVFSRTTIGSRHNAKAAGLNSPNYRSAGANDGEAAPLIDLGTGSL